MAARGTGNSGSNMEVLCRRWEAADSAFGNGVVLAFLAVQLLDGIFTYLGVKIWGPGIEANPLVSSAVSAIGLGGGLAVAKLVAVGLGIVLHLRRVHNLVALLTAIYICGAIIPWAALFLSIRG